MKTFTHGSLFSGIGGAEVAASMMGWDNVFHCEIQPFPRKVLDYWFPNAESYEDITKTDFTKWRGKIDILTGGFPCQPFSLAGRRAGAEDDRYLWPEMLRAIREIQPTWIVGENVNGIITMVQPSQDSEVGCGGSLFEENHTIRAEQSFTLEEICQNLEHEGYSVQPIVIPACAVGAPHRRDRVWIIAHRNCNRFGDGASEQEPQQGSINKTDISCNGAQQGIQQDASITNCNGLERCAHAEIKIQQGRDRQKQPTAEYTEYAASNRANADTNCDRIQSCTKSERAKADGSEVYDEQSKWCASSERTDGLPAIQRNLANTECFRWNEKPDDNGKPEETQQAKCGQEHFVPPNCSQGWRWESATQPHVCGRDDGIQSNVDDITHDGGVKKKELIEQTKKLMQRSCCKTLLPTLAAWDWVNANMANRKGKDRNSQMKDVIGRTFGKDSLLNPLYAEEMMGFPLGWTICPYLSPNGGKKA